MNHRNLIACLCLPPLMMAADFWQEKDPAQWTEKEITRLRTNSPWARDASVEFNMGRMGNSPGGPGGGHQPACPVTAHVRVRRIATATSDPSVNA